MAWRELIGGVPIGGGRFVIPNPKKGFPDIAGLFANGRHFAIEIKSKSGKVEPHQQKWLDDLASFGSFVLVARSLDEVISAMEPEIALAIPKSA